MTLSAALKDSKLITWKSCGRLQQTIARCIERSGVGLHSGKLSTLKILPESAGIGRVFDFRSQLIPAFIHYAHDSPLCTTLCKHGFTIRTVEHLLSALEAKGVDNCRIQICNDAEEEQDADDVEVGWLVTKSQVPIFDGSARLWVESLEQVGLKVALDSHGNNAEKMVAHLNEPVHVRRNDSFVAAFPSQEARITCGIDFPQTPAIGCQWFSSTPLIDSFYDINIASSRTFCIYEEIEHMRNSGLIKGGSLDNAIVCSLSKGWLNPPLRFKDEPCRHKALDVIGDLSLFAQSGSQGLPVAHIVAYKGGHTLHAAFVRHLLQIK
ncbi:hypothetical protein ACFE04_020289 [Oxalis oulophora]